MIYLSSVNWLPILNGSLGGVVRLIETESGMVSSRGWEGKEESVSSGESFSVENGKGLKMGVGMVTQFLC